MRRQDKYKNIEQANLMLENSYLKRKGLLKEETENSVKFKITDKFYEDMNMSYSTLQPENDKSTFGERLNNNTWQLIGKTKSITYDEFEPELGEGKLTTTSFLFAKFDKDKKQIDLETLISKKVKERDKNGTWTGKMVDGNGYKYFNEMLMYRSENDRRYSKTFDFEGVTNRFNDLTVGIRRWEPSKFESLEPGQVDNMGRFIVA